MAYLWAGMLLCGMAGVCLRAGGEAALASMMAGANEAVALMLEMAGAYLLFCGLMGVMKRAGLMEKLSRALAKPVRFLCPGAGEATGIVALALAANVLGLGNAATPLGIEAIRKLDEVQPAGGVATDDMCVFIAVNASALQLVPTGVIALRQAAGSASPASVTVASLLATAASCATAVLLCLLLRRRRMRG